MKIVLVCSQLARVLLEWYIRRGGSAGAAVEDGGEGMLEAGCGFVGCWDGRQRRGSSSCWSKNLDIVMLPLQLSVCIDEV